MIDERVCELCWLAMKERDPTKLRELISEINSVMDRRKEESRRAAVASGSTKLEAKRARAMVAALRLKLRNRPGVE